MKNPLRRWLWLAAGAIVLGLVVYHLSRSPEWRGFEWRRLWTSLASARRGPLLAALAATYSSYLIRAYRWKVFLDPVKRASLWVLFVGQILGFSSIYLVGRPGEFVRPAYIAKKENVSFVSMGAVWLLERIYDMVFLVFLFAVALYVAPVEPTTARGHFVVAWLEWGGRVMFLVTALLVAALAALRLKADRLMASAQRAGRLLPAWAGRGLEHFLRSFIKGLAAIRTGKDFLAGVVSTVVLWMINTGVFWLVFQSMGKGLERLSWLDSVMVMFFAVLGLAVQFPGVGGGYQVGALLALTEIYGVRPEVATGASILTWVMISVPCLVLGVVLLAYEGLTFKRLKAIAEEGRAAAEDA